MRDAIVFLTVFGARPLTGLLQHDCVMNETAIIALNADPCSVPASERILC